MNVRVYPGKLWLPLLESQFNTAEVVVTVSSHNQEQVVLWASALLRLT